MSDTVYPKPAELVRVATTIGGGAARIVYAIVLHTIPGELDTVGSNGEPVVSVAYMESGLGLEKTLGGPEWYKALHRESGVPHASSQAVQEGKRSVYWTDLLPVAGFAGSVGELKEAAAPTGVQPSGLVLYSDDRTGQSVQTDGQGAFKIVRADGTNVVAGDAPSGRSAVIRFSSIQAAKDYISEQPTPVIPPDKTSELAPGVTTEEGFTLPPKPTDVPDATGALGSSESLTPIASGTETGVSTVTEEDGKFYVKYPTGDYLLDEQTMEAKVYGSRAEAEEATGITPHAPEAGEPFAPPTTETTETGISATGISPA